MYQRISKNFNKLTHTKYEPVPPSLMWILADYIGDFRQNNLQLNFRLWDLVMNNFSPLWQSKFVRDISVFHMIVFSVKYQNFYTFYSHLKNATYFTRFLLHILTYFCRMCFWAYQKYTSLGPENDLSLIIISQ